jgi:hypothetical protein
VLAATLRATAWLQTIRRQANHGLCSHTAALGSISTLRSA